MNRVRCPFYSVIRNKGVAISLLAFFVAGCSPFDKKTTPGDGEDDYSGLEDKISDVIKDRPGRFGIAVIVDNADTITVNDLPEYPLMSMFKLHQAVAVCHCLDMRNISLDSVVSISRNEVDENTWSPMLKEFPSVDFSLSVGRLLEYLLVDSDNNASNLLFDKIVSVKATDSIVGNLLPGKGFGLRFKEAEMKEDKERSYDNSSTPLSYASLVNRIFTDSVVSSDKQAFIKKAMYNCKTGERRLMAPLSGKDGVMIAHRTGSGYVNEYGEIIAINDGGYVGLPGGHGYSIAVFVRDYAGKQEDAEDAISEISRVVFDYISEKHN